jgi:hypothetical protein
MLLPSGLVIFKLILSKYFCVLISDIGWALFLGELLESLESCPVAAFYIKGS